ncbi:MAG: hypothetical protein GY790_15505 [Bacteroidetes bacterium]|nr:hypothetical protein [Bacteroidota bacterium]
MKYTHLTGILLLFLAIFTCERFEASHYLIVHTDTVSNVSFTSATLNGLLLDIPEQGIGDHGFCWSRSSMPELEKDPSYHIGSISEAGSFSQNIEGLFSNTTYYLRAHASDDLGTVYGDELEFSTLAGIPAKLQQKKYGGGKDDHARSIISTSDGAYVLAGYSNSADGDVSDSHGDFDFWILKLDMNGKMLWQRSLGGEGEDRARAIIETLDGGFAIVGDSYTPEAGYDFRIAKLSMNGDVQWEKTFGGSSYDIAHSVIQAADGSFIVAGYSESSDGDVTNNQGHQDCWIIKLSSGGDLIWQKSMGGTLADEAFTVLEAPDGGFMVAGQTYSSDGDVDENHGNSDIWLVKLNQRGCIQWQKTLGGSGHEAAKSLLATPDGGYALAGLTYSSDGDVSMNHGDCDYWIVKTGGEGNIQWEKTLGGSKRDDARAISLTADNGFVVAGSSHSGDGDITEAYGGSDYWIVKLDLNGSLEWQKSWGGSASDQAYSVFQTPGDGFVLAGESYSSDGHITSHHGGCDYWVAIINY